MSQERLCLNISSVDYVADNGYWSIIGDLRYLPRYYSHTILYKVYSVESQVLYIHTIAIIVLGCTLCNSKCISTVILFL